MHLQNNSWKKKNYGPIKPKEFMRITYDPHGCETQRRNKKIRKCFQVISNPNVFVCAMHCTILNRASNYVASNTCASVASNNNSNKFNESTVHWMHWMICAQRGNTFVKIYVAHASSYFCVCIVRTIGITIQWTFELWTTTTMTTTKLMAVYGKFVKHIFHLICSSTKRLSHMRMFLTTKYRWYSSCCWCLACRNVWCDCRHRKTSLRPYFV